MLLLAYCNTNRFDRGIKTQTSPGNRATQNWRCLNDYNLTTWRQYSEIESHAAKCQLLNIVTPSWPFEFCNLGVFLTWSTTWVSVSSPDLSPSFEASKELTKLNAKHWNCRSINWVLTTPTFPLEKKLTDVRSMDLHHHTISVSAIETLQQRVSNIMYHEVYWRLWRRGLSQDWDSELFRGRQRLCPFSRCDHCSRKVSGTERGGRPRRVLSN